MAHYHSPSIKLVSLFVLFLTLKSPGLMLCTIRKLSTRRGIWALFRDILALQRGSYWFLSYIKKYFYFYIDCGNDIGHKAHNSLGWSPKCHLAIHCSPSSLHWWCHLASYVKSRHFFPIHPLNYVVCFVCCWNCNIINYIKVCID